MLLRCVQDHGCIEDIFLIFFLQDRFRILIKILDLLHLVRENVFNGFLQSFGIWLGSGVLLRLFVFRAGIYYVLPGDILRFFGQAAGQIRAFFHESGEKTIACTRVGFSEHLR